MSEPTSDSDLYKERLKEWRRAVVISSETPPAEIIDHLTENGCQDLTDDLDPSSISAQPVSHGGYGLVYREKRRDGTQVAIKALRVPLDDDDEAGRLPKLAMFASSYTKYLCGYQRAARELYAWSKCQHRNVLPLLGLILFQGQIRMVSRWMENGSLPSYLNKHPDVDRRDMSAQICDGVAYLHLTGVVHGDLKGNNVLVSEDGTPMITDFGNAVLEQGTMQFTETMKGSGFTPRWAAPEILDEREVKQSEEADVYALGMIILEVITGKVPYSHINNPVALIKAIAIRNEIPKRPEHIPSDSEHGDALWSLLRRCWAYEPENRPKAYEVAETMKGITSSGLVPVCATSDTLPQDYSTTGGRPGLSPTG